MDAADKFSKMAAELYEKARKKAPLPNSSWNWRPKFIWCLRSGRMKPLCKTAMQRDYSNKSRAFSRTDRSNDISQPRSRPYRIPGTAALVRGRRVLNTQRPRLEANQLRWATSSHGSFTKYHRDSKSALQAF